MIPEAEIEKAVNWLRDSSTACAQARANRLHLEQWVKVVLAQEMTKHKDLSNAAADVLARVSKEYRDALDGLKEAIEQDEKNRFLREAAMARIEAWRTQSSNERALGNVR